MNTSNSFKDLPKLLEKPTESEGGGTPDNMLEVVRLLREIHAAVCGGEQKEPKHGGVRKRFRHIVLSLMVPGKSHIAEDFMEGLKAQGVETTIMGVNSALTKLAADSEVVRVRSGIYKLPDAQGEIRA